MATIRGLRPVLNIVGNENAGLSAPQVTSAGGAFVGFPVTVWVQTRYPAMGGSGAALAVTCVLAGPDGTIFDHLQIVSSKTAWTGTPYLSIPYADVVFASKPIPAQYAGETLAAWLAPQGPLGRPVLTQSAAPDGSSVYTIAQRFPLATVSFQAQTPPASSGGQPYTGGGGSGTGTGTSTGAGTGTSSGGAPSTGSGGSPSSSSGTTPTVPTPTSAAAPTVLGLPQATAILVAAGTVAAAGIAIAVAAGGR